MSFLDLHANRICSRGKVTSNESKIYLANSANFSLGDKYVRESERHNSGVGATMELSAILCAIMTLSAADFH